MLEERGRPILLPTRNPGELRMEANPEVESAIRNILSIFVQSTALWFRIEYTLGGIRLGIEPEDFIAKRTGSEDDRLKFLREKPRELSEASNVIITIINPRRIENPPL